MRDFIIRLIARLVSRSRQSDIYRRVLPVVKRVSQVIPFPIFNVIKRQYISLQFKAFFEQKLALATRNGMRLVIVGGNGKTSEFARNAGDRHSLFRDCSADLRPFQRFCNYLVVLSLAISPLISQTVPNRLWLSDTIFPSDGFVIRERLQNPV